MAAGVGASITVAPLHHVHSLVLHCVQLLPAIAMQFCARQLALHPLCALPLQVYRVTSVQPQWAALASTPLAASPHTVALQLGGPDDGNESATSCTDVSRSDVQPGDGAPTIQQLLCGLVQRANAEAAGRPQAAAAGPDEARGMSPPGPVDQAVNTAKDLVNGAQAQAGRPGALLATAAAAMVLALALGS